MHGEPPPEDGHLGGVGVKDLLLVAAHRLKELPLGPVGLHWHLLGVPLGEGALFSFLAEPLLHVPPPPLHHVLLGGLPIQGTALKKAQAARIQVLQEAMEALGVAVVGGGGEEEVGHPQGELPHQAVALHLLAPLRGGAGGEVGFVHQEEVPALPEDQVAHPVLLGIVQAGDDPVKVGPGVRPRGEAPGQALEVGPGEDLKLQVEEAPQRLPPLAEEVGRGQDQDPAGLVAEEELLKDEARLHRLPQAHVVGEEEAHLGLAQGHEEGDELVVGGHHPGALEGEEGGVGVEGGEVQGPEEEVVQRRVPGGGGGKSQGGEAYPRAPEGEVEEGLLLGVHGPGKEDIPLAVLQAVVPPPGSEEGPRPQELQHVHRGIISPGKPGSSPRACPVPPPGRPPRFPWGRGAFRPSGRGFGSSCPCR